MPDMGSIAHWTAEWAALALNAAALLAGACVWMLYTARLRAELARKGSEVARIRSENEGWRAKVRRLEHRSPEAVQQRLRDRLARHEEELHLLVQQPPEAHRQHGRQLVALHEALEQTSRYLEVVETATSHAPEYDTPLGSETPVDLGAERGLPAERPRELEVEESEIELLYLGSVGVDSGQLLLTDPCYIDTEWAEEPFEDVRIYRDRSSGAEFTWGEDFQRFNELLEPYGETPNALIAQGRLVKVEPSSAADGYTYSYNGACQATLAEGFGDLTYPAGGAGAGVVLQTGWGDGVYPVYGERRDGRIVRAYVTFGSEPAALQ